MAATSSGKEKDKITPTFLPLPTDCFQSIPSSELITSSCAAAPPAWIYNTQIYSAILNKYIYIVVFFFFFPFEHKPPFPPWTRVQITITGPLKHIFLLIGLAKLWATNSTSLLHVFILWPQTFWILKSFHKFLRYFSVAVNNSSSGAIILKNVIKI